MTNLKSENRPSSLPVSPSPQRTLTDLVAPLPDAACVGRWALFDPASLEDHETIEDLDYRHTRAATICRSCPVLDACRTWVDSLPERDRPGGVVAARIPRRPHRRGRPRKDTAA